MKSVVLCYNLRDTKKGRKIAMIFASLGYRVRHVEKGDYGQPIGVLAGADSKPDEKKIVYDGEGFSDEMLVMYAEKQQMFDRALMMMRKEKSVVDLKAVLTETNSNWDSIRLHEELMQEHQYMTEQKGIRKH